MIKKRYTISLCIIAFISVLLYIGLTSLKIEAAIGYDDSSSVPYLWSYGIKGVEYTPNQVIIPKYSWKRDHCESCSYLAKQIKHWMDEARQFYNWQIRNIAANMAANYLKLYELNECHGYYRNTSIGPFHLALELKAEKGRKHR